MAFKAAENEGWVSAELYFNMGLAFYRQDQIGQAIRYLEKALLLDGENEGIQHSLRVARVHTEDQFSQLRSPFWNRMHAWTIRVLPPRLSIWLGLLFWFGFAGLFVGRKMANLDGEWWRRIRTVCVVLGVALSFHALASSTWPPESQRAVILASQIDLLEQAAPEADSVQLVHEGLVVSVKSVAADWVLVQIPNGVRGWVPAAHLGEI